MVDWFLGEGFTLACSSGQEGGGPPTLAYLMTLRPMFNEWRATEVVVEWDEMFLWSVSLYTMGMVGELLRAAEQHKLDVIPLVQTFGHLGFVLKQEQFKHHREMELFPNSMMPVAVDSEETGVRVLVTEMLRQVETVHTSLSIIHIDVR